MTIPALRISPKRFLLDNWLILLYFTAIAFCLYINSLHFSYPDEFDNIVGGFFIDHGRLPYTGFFTHHGPVAYFYAALLGIFTGASFVKFRILYNLLFVVYYALFYRFILKCFGLKEARIILFFIGLVVVSATFDWGHMLLADSFAGILLIPVYITLFFTIFKRQFLSTKELIMISILTSLGLLTSVTYIYVVLIIYIFTLINFLQYSKFKIFQKSSLWFTLIMAAPYLVFLLYLLATRSLGDYYYQSIFFNQHYYITSLNGVTANNPLRFAIAIFWAFYQNFQTILVQTKDLNFGFPFAQTMALADFLTLIYLVINRRFQAALLVLGFLVYLNARSNPYTTMETDYQALPYHYFSFFNTFFILKILWDDLKLQIEVNKKIIYSLFLLFLGSYTIFLSIFLFGKAFDKAYQKYMGTQSLIYDRPLVANTLNELLGPNDYYYIGPFAFQEYLYMKTGNLASRYFITIPAMDKSQKIQSELLSDMQKNKPKIVVFDTEYFIFGEQPGLYLVKYLKQNYFTLEDFKNEGYNFDVKVGNFGIYDFKRHFFFDKNRQDEIIQDLVNAGLITQPTKTTIPQTKTSTKKA